MNANGDNSDLCCRLTFILAMFLVFLAVFPSRVFAFAYIALALIFSIKYPVMGLVGWIMGYPYFNIFTDTTGVLGYFVLAPLVGAAILSLMSRRTAIKLSVKGLFSGNVALVLASFSLFFSRDLQSSIVPFGMFSVALVVVATIILVVKYYPTSWYVLNEAYVMAVVAILISTLLTGSLFDAGRLSLGESIRRVANVASPAIIILFMEFTQRLSRTKNTIRGKQRPLPITGILLMICIIVLLSTVSRGAFMAVVAAGFFVLVFRALFVRMGGNPAKRVLLYAVGLLLLVWTIGFVEDHISGSYLARASLSNFGGNIRWDIWRNTIAQMKLREYFVGAGPNTFRELALLGGHDHYAHSVFVDAFVSFGLLSLLGLALLLLTLLFKSIRQKNIYTFGMIVLLVGLYSTHGNLTGSLDFWTLIGLAWASLIVQKRLNGNRITVSEGITAENAPSFVVKQDL